MIKIGSEQRFFFPFRRSPFSWHFNIRISATHLQPRGRHSSVCKDAHRKTTQLHVVAFGQLATSSRPYPTARTRRVLGHVMSFGNDFSPRHIDEKTNHVLTCRQYYIVCTHYGYDKQSAASLLESTQRKPEHAVDDGAKRKKKTFSRSETSTNQPANRHKKKKKSTRQQDK